MTQTPKDRRDAAAMPAVRFTPGSGPVQLVTRLLELTPELYAHYADEPVHCPIPECACGGTEHDAEGDDSATL